MPVMVDAAKFRSLSPAAATEDERRGLSQRGDQGGQTGGPSSVT